MSGCQNVGCQNVPVSIGQVPKCRRIQQGPDLQYSGGEDPEHQGSDWQGQRAGQEGEGQTFGSAGGEATCREAGYGPHRVGAH